MNMGSGFSKCLGEWNRAKDHAKKEYIWFAVSISQSVLRMLRLQGHHAQVCVCQQTVGM